jgi:ABC-type Na+ transport system ATPase subunit NatA
MTAWEMVEHFGRLHGIPDDELAARMEAIFARLTMNDFRDLLGAKMSTGMRQKVSVARAVIHDPPVLIFDEATAGLDVLVARALLNTVAELRAHMEQLFKRLKMNEIRDLLGAKMSTGMKQKVSVARAIVHDPPVLIFDEATAGLDVLVARALLRSVAELREQGKCILFSTHIMREAEKLCDRIAILHRGRILAEGALEALRDQHHERDLEELFFQLISQHDEAYASSNDLSLDSGRRQ